MIFSLNTQYQPVADMECAAKTMKKFIGRKGRDRERIPRIKNFLINSHFYALALLNLRFSWQLIPQIYTIRACNPSTQTPRKGIDVTERPLGLLSPG